MRRFLFISVCLLTMLFAKAQKTTQLARRNMYLYRALRMVLPSDDPNLSYIEKYFSVQRNEDVIDNVRNRIAVSAVFR